MSLDLKIQRNRTLKRTAAEFRHLLSRLAHNCSLAHSAADRGHESTLEAANATVRQETILHTRCCGTTARQRYESCVGFDLHARVKLRCPVCTAERKEASELSAMTEALCILPSDTEWRRLLTAFDSDVSVEFDRLLSCCDAAAIVEVGAQETTELASGRDRHAADRPPAGRRYKATVSVAMPDMEEEESGVLLVGEGHTVGLPGTLKWSGRVPGAPVKEESSAFFPARYDFGAGSDWSASPRDAVKAALAEATSVLREAAAGELRAAGREGALLLNELRAGGSCTDDFDAIYLSSVLAKDFDRTLTSSDASSSFSCPSAALRWRVRVHPLEPESGSAAARTDSNMTVTSQGDGERGAATAAAAVDGVALVEVSGVEKTVGSIERVPCERVREHISMAIAAPFLSASERPSGSAKSSHRGGRDGEAEELRSLLPGSVLLFLACQRCSLYRRTRCWTRESCTFTAGRSGEGSIVTADLAARGTSLPVSWRALPRLSAFSPTRQSSLAKRVGSPLNTGESSVGSMVLRARNALQNVWHCPDVVVMLAELRLLLRLPHTSFPTIAFSQTAVHDPARRTRELANGCYGDVDVLTRVQITWSTPRGTFTALAESDPSKHAGRPADPADGVRWLACEDTGSPRGPLPLLLAAVCSLYRTVKGIGSSSLQHYPLIPLQNPRSRSSLDFLLYSWFAASPQIRCFAISTTRPGTAAAAAMAVDGVSQVVLGTTMTRAMLFYDLLGQRVLFAETHAADLESAVARLEVLAVERNQIPHDAYVPVSAARERPYRDIGRLQRWQDASRAAAAAWTGSRGPPPLLHRLLRQCARTSGSELCALWTVVEVMSHWLRPSTATAVSCADAEEKKSRRGSVVGDDCLSMRFLPDAPLREGDSDEEESLQRAWASGAHGSWSARPLGTEAPPPPSGLVELWWSPPTVQTAAAGEGEAAAVEGGGTYRPVCFRYQVDPLLSESTSRRAARGILPALTLLCREALHNVYGCLCQLHGEGSGSGAAAQRLPLLDELLAWCAEADPVMVRRSDGFPPYDARFYAAPALLGEVLQGVAGKYACAYRALPQRTQAASDSHAYGSEWAATSAGGYAGLPSSPPQQQQQQPSTVFYTSAALNVDPSVEADADDGGPWAASRRRTEAQSAPPSVQCTLFIDSIVGHKVRCEHRAPAEVPNAFSLPPDTASGEGELAKRVVLGHGVGRTKREAWSSAAWQALRLQFSEVLTQVEALRDVAEATRQPYQLNLLLAQAPVSQTDSSSTGDSPPRSPAFRLEWAWRRAPSVWTTKVGGSSRLRDTGAMVERASGVVCTARLVCADGTHVSLPQTAATGCSAAEAYVRCARGVLRQIGEARRAAQDALRGTGTAWAGPTVWSSWSSAAQPPTAPLVSAEARRGAPPYAQWRLTTHYAKSLWHAYAGALSLHVKCDLVVLLVHVMEGHTAAFGSSSSGDGSGERDRWRGEASHALVVDQLSVLQVRERGDVRQRGSPLQQQQRHVGSGFSDSPLRGDGFHSCSPFQLGVSAAVAGGGGGTAPCETFVFSHTPASLVARHTSSPPSPTLSPTPSDVPQASTGFAVLREASSWLRELTQECALPLQARSELQGLVCGRLSELRSMQRASRWSAGERVEALLRRWTGCPARVRLHRRTAASQSRRGEEEGGGGGGNEWVAQALLQVTVERGGLYGSPNSSSEGDRWEGIDGGSGGGGDGAAYCGVVSVTERGWWVVGSAAAATSEDAVWTLFREACAAVDEVEAVLLAEKPPMVKQRNES